MIRQAKVVDLERIIEIIDDAKDRFKQNGIDQWQNGYPNKTSILNDIEKACAYVYLVDDIIQGYFYMAIEDDPYYTTIKDGQWLNANPYAVVHRFVVNQKQQRKGYAKDMMASCFDIICKQDIYDIRVDTHDDNKPMNQFLLSLGFVYCGEVKVADGPRNAYQCHLNRR